jgi:hypothetical protein
VFSVLVFSVLVFSVLVLVLVHGNRQHTNTDSNSQVPLVSGSPFVNKNVLPSPTRPPQIYKNYLNMSISFKNKLRGKLCDICEKLFAT